MLTLSPLHWVVWGCGWCRRHGVAAAVVPCGWLAEVVRRNEDRLGEIGRRDEAASGDAGASIAAIPFEPRFRWGRVVGPTRGGGGWVSGPGEARMRYSAERRGPRDRCLRR